MCVWPNHHTSWERKTVLHGWLTRTNKTAPRRWQQWQLRTISIGTIRQRHNQATRHRRRHDRLPSSLFLLYNYFSFPFIPSVEGEDLDQVWIFFLLFLPFFPSVSLFNFGSSPQVCSDTKLYGMLEFWYIIHETLRKRNEEKEKVICEEFHSRNSLAWAASRIYIKFSRFYTKPPLRF